MQVERSTIEGGDLSLSWRLQRPVDTMLIGLSLAQADNLAGRQRSQREGQWYFIAPGDATTSWAVPLGLEPGCQYSAIIRACAEEPPTGPMANGLTQLTHRVLHKEVISSLFVSVSPVQAMKFRAKLEDSRHVVLSWRLGAPVDTVLIILHQHVLHHHPEHHGKRQPRGLPSGDKPGEEWCFVVPGHGAASFHVPFTLEPGRRYTATVKACVLSEEWGTGDNEPGLISYKVTHENRATFRASLTQDELQQLLGRATSHMSKNAFLPFQWFYRDKPQQYYDEIMHAQGGVMDAYIKDRNGDPASPINETVNGLFFGVNVDWKTGQPLVPSHFGPQRLLVPAAVMFNIFPNLYFADFYCNRQAHYVTLVMTVPGSATDVFCGKKLLKLDLRENPFVRYDGRSVGASASRKVWVEILCTESLHIPVLFSLGAWFNFVESNGVSRPDGIPKNPTCAKCNLYS